MLSYNFVLFDTLFYCIASYGSSQLPFFSSNNKLLVPTCWTFSYTHVQAYSQPQSLQRVRSRYLRPLLVVLTRFIITAICHLCDIQNFTSMHGDTLNGLIFQGGVTHICCVLRSLSAVKTLTCLKFNLTLDQHLNSCLTIDFH